MKEEKIQRFINTRSTQQRLIHYWEESLLLLQECGVKIKFCDRTYPVSLRPSWWLPDTEKEPINKTEKRPRGYAEKILQGMITLIAPRPEDAKPIKSPSKKKKNPQNHKFTGEKVKKARESLGWSLRELAHVADIPYSTIANIERGRNISKPNEEKLLKALPALSELT